jgi:hypothetical protein
VWSVECGVWSVECGVWSVEVWSVECGVWSAVKQRYLIADMTAIEQRGSRWEE